MMSEKREQIEKLSRALVVLRADLHDLEATFSRLQNETVDLYEKLDGMLDADI